MVSAMMTPHGPRVVAAIITAPLAVSVRVVENGPEIVGRVRQELTLARFIGKMAVDQGRRELKRRLDGERPAHPPAVVAREALPEVGDPGEPSPVSETSDVDVVDAADLALDDYDQLPAAQIVAKLAGLTASERAQIGRYEAAHRHRRTVLGKLEQLDA